MTQVFKHNEWEMGTLVCCLSQFHRSYDKYLNTETWRLRQTSSAFIIFHRRQLRTFSLYSMSMVKAILTRRTNMLRAETDVFVLTPLLELKWWHKYNGCLWEFIQSLAFSQKIVQFHSYCLILTNSLSELNNCQVHIHIHNTYIIWF